MENLEVLKEPGGAEIKIHIISLEEKVNEIIDLLELMKETEKIKEMEPMKETEKRSFFAKAKK